MLEVQLFDLGYCKEEEYTRVVCVCRYKGKFLFSYNKKREGTFGLVTKCHSLIGLHLKWIIPYQVLFVIYIIK
jgi:hypothetical protein